jgi:hypothetical protein
MQSVTLTPVEDEEETDQDKDTHQEDEQHLSGTDSEKASIDQLCRQCSRLPLGKRRLRHTISEAQERGRVLGRLSRYWTQIGSGGQLEVVTCVFCSLVKEAYVDLAGQYRMTVSNCT